MSGPVTDAPVMPVGGFSTMSTHSAAPPENGWNICMVSDFFYPNMGGVESHLYCLSQRLISRGHKVIIVTHAYGHRGGIRYLANGLKVYYLPLTVMYSQSTFPTVITSFPLVRNIWIREQIQIVHGHQAFSTLCHESVLHARTMGLRVCFTDHSLFGFADLSSILMNKMLKFTLSDIDHVICVSNTSKENTVLRGALNPHNVSVIPNAVVAEQLMPDPSMRDPNFVTIVVLSRLVYRKGMDLLVATIPRVCAIHPKVKFIIAGDGPKKIDLEQMRERHLLHDRVEFLGAFKHHEVRKVLCRGHIFLNTSLTEAFCMAIIEAACCGLLVVSTKVGGVPEVLPQPMIILAKPEEDDLLKAILRAIDKIMFKEISTDHFHELVKAMYSWENIAIRTEKVYLRCLQNRPASLIERMRRYYGTGAWFGKILCLLCVLDFLLHVFLEFFWPASSIDICPRLAKPAPAPTRSASEQPHDAQSSDRDFAFPAPSPPPED